MLQRVFTIAAFSVAAACLVVFALAAATRPGA